jgi:hypothetical protein
MSLVFSPPRAVVSRARTTVLSVAAQESSSTSQESPGPQVDTPDALACLSVRERLTTGIRCHGGHGYLLRRRPQRSVESRVTQLLIEYRAGSASSLRRDSTT